ncbi:MAG TPA: glycerophosphodiester phosphodiesterase family protein [Edaphobacter sp.]|jgi:glycerophosphoryl diester phosphodiesterase|nr:glycerophosphodiester phosphodiesterase family protein [Edaphobacter sp.]
MLISIRAAALAVIIFAPMSDPYLGLLTAANDHAKAHGAPTPTLSPVDATVLGPNAPVNVAELHKAGFKVLPWTTNDPEKIRALINLRVDGIISDYPDRLQKVLAEEKSAHPAEATYFNSFVSSAHRGGRGLRPENTLPSFENGLDHLVRELETDTGVTTDHVSLIWHDQFLNPESCRRADGKPYTRDQRVYIRDLSLAEAQSIYICDKLHQGPEYGNARFDEQQNDLTLSPAAVAFAKKEKLISPYVPTHAEQLFHFVAFYVDYYTSGPGKSHPDAVARAANARTVRFNLETKITPFPNDPAGPAPALAEHHEPTTNHTFEPQVFVTALCGAITRNHMESRAEVQSFDFRTLQLIEEQFPKIPTYYLTGAPNSLSSNFVPASLRQPNP